MKESSPFLTIAITVCDEHQELERSLSLFEYFRSRPSNFLYPKIIVVFDRNKVTDKVIKVLERFNINSFPFDFRGDFADLKNSIFQYVDTDYILQLDADEYISEQLWDILENHIRIYPDCDIFFFPRVNTVEGIAAADHQNLGWTLSEAGWVNFPDYQGRLYRNVPHKIQWTSKVHEYLAAVGNYQVKKQFLPPNYFFALIHPKKLDKQRSQLKYYDGLMRDNSSRSKKE